MRPLCALASLIVVTAAVAAEPDKDGFVPMFNGKDLTGWVNVNTHPSTFFVKDDMIITTGKPTGYMRTDKQYENFVAEFDWMHVPPKPDAVGNSGFFVWADPLPGVGTPYSRGIEVQVLVNLKYTDKTTGAVTATSHGDLFSIHGATCKPDRPHPLGWARCLPSEDRAKGANEWNHYRVTANDGVIKLEVNGKEVSGVSECKPRKGYLALESEGSECRFRNLKIKELASTNPKPEEIAKEAAGHQLIFNGLDLEGWNGDHAAWKTGDGVLRAQKDGSALLTEKKYTNFELVFDWRPRAKRDAGTTPHPQIVLRMDDKPDALAKDSGVVLVSTATDNRVSAFGGKEQNSKIVENAIKDFKPDQWHRVRITLKANSLSVEQDGHSVIENWVAGTLNPSGKIGLSGFGGADFMSVYVRELK